MAHPSGGQTSHLWHQAAEKKKNAAMTSPALTGRVCFSQVSRLTSLTLTSRVFPVGQALSQFTPSLVRGVQGVVGPPPPAPLLTVSPKHHLCLTVCVWFGWLRSCRLTLACNGILKPPQGTALAPLHLLLLTGVRLQTYQTDSWVRPTCPKVTH